MKPIAAYIRVSTSQQDRSGLGIEAQREALTRFANEFGYEMPHRRSAGALLRAHSRSRLRLGRHVHSAEFVKRHQKAPKKELRSTASSARARRGGSRK